MHNEAFRRIEGIPATVRVDHEKTTVSRGAGAWDEFNPSYRRYARTVRYHIDACPPRTPQAKGKVERDVRTSRGAPEINERRWSSWDELQHWSDERLRVDAEPRICPATGASVLETWQAKKRFLPAVPLLPEAFDLAGTRTVASDRTVALELRAVRMAGPRGRGPRL